MLKIIDHKLFSGSLVREVKIDRPPVNAFNLELLTRLQQALSSEPEDGVGAYVISGTRSVFSAGMDVKDAAVLDQGGIKQLFQALTDVTLSIGLCKLPIACAISGNCLGAGAVFSLFCDYRVMARARTDFGITEVKGGMSMGPHVFYALSRIIGEHRAQQMLLESVAMSSEAAYDMGLADELVANHLVSSRAVAWCDRMLKSPAHAVQQTRDMARAGIVRALQNLKGQSKGERASEWFDDGAQKSAAKLLKEKGYKDS